MLNQRVIYRDHFRHYVRVAPASHRSLVDLRPQPHFICIARHLRRLIYQQLDPLVRYLYSHPNLVDNSAGTEPNRKGNYYGKEEEFIKSCNLDRRRADHRAWRLFGWPSIHKAACTNHDSPHL